MNAVDNQFKTAQSCGYINGCQKTVKKKFLLCVYYNEGHYQDIISLEEGGYV